MPVLIPLTSAGERRVEVATGAQTLIFRSYYVKGADRHWLLDIADSRENPLFSGLCLTPGADNLLKGGGDALEGCRLLLLAEPGAEKDPDAPGSTLWLAWLNPGEANPCPAPDPLDAISRDFWA